jgi:hypothetical protein
MTKENDIVSSEEYRAMLASRSSKELPSVVTSPKVVEKRLEAAPVNYCNGDCQRGIAPFVERVNKIAEASLMRSERIWPVEFDQIRQWAAEDVVYAKKREDFQKYLDSSEYLEKVRASAKESVKRWTESRPHDKVYEEVKEPKVKQPKVKKASRQTRLGQTKMIDDLLKLGKTEKEIFDTVREKIPEYPADKLPKLIKLRQYHVKK